MNRRMLVTLGISFLSLFLLVIPGISQEPVDDHGDDPDALVATFITADNFQLDASIEEAGDRDCFTFEANSDNTYLLQVTQATGDLDPLIILFDRNGLTLLALDDDGDGSSLAVLELNPLIDGFYFVCVRNTSSTSGSGNYTLRITSNAGSGSTETLPEPPESTGNETPPPPAQEEPEEEPMQETPAPPQEEEPATEESMTNNEPEMPEESSPNEEPETTPPAEEEPTTPPEPEQPTTPPETSTPPTNTGESTGRIAVVGGDDSTSLQDVQSYLSFLRIFTEVVIIDAAQSTPTASELSAFDAVLVWADNGFDDPVALGNHLADYVDQGGGVVVAAVSFDEPSPFDPDTVEGRFFDQDYYVIQPGVDNTDEGRRILGMIQDANHPILTGVASIDGGPKSFHSPTNTLTSGSTPIAFWDNGDILVATKTINQARRADINLFPPSGRLDTDLWPFRPNNDVPELFANALQWVAGNI